MKPVLISILFIVIVLKLTSCTNENEVALYNLCDTLELSYTKDIKPIFEANCYSCHTGATPARGFDISNFDQLVTRLDSKLLINAINRKSGFPQMPKYKDKLPDCLIQKITAWNNAGHPQN